MTDELDDLKAALSSATPKPDAARKADILARAQENFDHIQGTASEPRPTPTRGIFSRIGEGTKIMLNTLSTKAALGLTTATAALALVLILPTDELAELGTRKTTAPSAELLDAAEPEIASGAPEARSVEADVVMPSLFAEEDAAIAPAAPQTMRADRGAIQLSDDAAPLVVGNSVIVIEEDTLIVVEEDTESFANAPENALNVTTESPVSTFSIDVDTASYAVVRSSLNAGQLPPRDAIRIEEMVNYFPYDYAAPENGDAFSQTVTVVPTPWNTGTNLVHIGIQGQMPATEDRPPLNLVFLIDTSGSMQSANKLPLLKQSFRLMLGQLRSEDQISIVTYAGSAGQVLAPTPAGERATILAALDRLEAGGSTAGAAGIELAYQVAEGMTDEGELTRVVLATDGDFNVGISDPDALVDMIAEKRDSGTYLSVLGFGRGNLDDAVMQALAQNGNGTASYIDTLVEARKVLVDQLSGALFPIANDVKIQVEFNPAQVAEWRLIGYETRALEREDFNNDRVDAGEIGAGHSVTAIYEVTPVGSAAIRNTPLRYGENSPETSTSDELGFLKLRYKQPGSDTSTLIETPILPETKAGTDDIRFSVAMAGFGQLLRDGDFLGSWGWAEAIQLANGARGDDPFGYRSEAVSLMRLAEALDQ